MVEIKERKTVIVNCLTVKKNSGGAFQIAKNFIISTLNDTSFNWYYWLSKDTYNSVLDEIQIVSKDKIFIFPNQPDFKKTFWTTKSKIRQIEKEIQADLIYTIASPSYFHFNTTEVMRYANAWFVNLNPYVLKKLNLKGKIRLKALTFIQHILMKRCKYFVTQTDASKDGILNVVGVNPENIKVIPNALPDLYRNFNQREFCRDLSYKSEIHILYVAVPHPHKNLNVIPKLLWELSKMCPLKKFYFHITIPNGDRLKQFNLLCEEMRVNSMIINHGFCTQNEIAQLYESTDLYFFPSLLETFSLSLLEAIYFRVPVIACDLDFNKSVAGDSALYFNPTNISEASNIIANFIKNPRLQEEIFDKMDYFYKNKGYFFSYETNFVSLLSFFTKVIENNIK